MSIRMPGMPLLAMRANGAVTLGATHLPEPAPAPETEIELEVEPEPELEMEAALEPEMEEELEPEPKSAPVYSGKRQPCG